MTTVPSNLGGSGGKGGGKARGGNPWHRLWQVPLLLAGLAAFGYGVRALVKTYKPVPFSAQVTGVENLLASGKYAEAIAAINSLGDYYKVPAQQGELQRLAGDAHYLAQKEQPAFVRENYEHINDHYGKAVALGVKPDATMNERWGEAELALGDAPL